MVVVVKQEYASIKELQSPQGDISEGDKPARVRAAGGCQELLTEIQPSILEAHKKLVSSEIYGNPENPLCWTAKSLRNLAEKLSAEGFAIKKDKVGNLLKIFGYSPPQRGVGESF